MDGPSPIDMDEFDIKVSQGEYVNIKDPLPKKYIGDHLPDRERAVRDERYERIKDLVIQKPNCYNKQWLQVEINKIFKERRQSKKLGEVEVSESEAEKEFSKYKIYSALRTFFIYGEKRNSLIPETRHCGGRGKERKSKGGKLGRHKIHENEVGTILSEDDKIKLAKGWKKYKTNIPENSIPAAYLDTIGEFYLKKKPFPSLIQFVRWGQLRNDPVEAKKISAGPIKFNKDERILTGSARAGIFGPGSQAQLDATTDDTHVISLVIEDTYIGRLTLLLLVDTFSAMPMGIVLAPENSSNYAGGLTLINAVTDKVVFCADHGIPIDKSDWPVEHLPVSILGDLGLLFGQKSDRVVDLEIHVSNAGAYRADMKPIVERFIGKLLASIKGVLADHGLVNKKDSPRIIADTRSKAVLDYKSLMSIIINQILYFMKHEPIEDYPVTDEMMAESVLPTPLNLWNFGIRKGYGALITEKPEELSVKLFESMECAYGREGISFFDDRWMCVSLEGREFFEKIHFGEKPKRLTVKYNKMNTSQVYLSHRGEYFKLYRVSGDITVATFLEVANNAQKLQALIAANESDRIQAGAAMKQRQRDIIKKAKAARGSKEIDTSDTRSARFRDQELHRSSAMLEKETATTRPRNAIDDLRSKLKLPDLLD